LEINSCGIYFQKIAWVIYSVYLFIKTAGLLVIKYEGGGGMLQSPFDSSSGVLGNIVAGIVSLVKPLIKPLIPDPKEAGLLLSLYSTQMLGLLMIVSIAIFIIMVLGNDHVTAWLLKSREDAAIQAYKSGLKLEKGRLGAISQDMMGVNK